MILSLLFAAAIELTGVTSSDLRARAFFDANNVKVGDPLTLTIDFLGSANFKDLHPPVLARHLSKKDWKLYDESARTDTFSDGRRLTYRVKPLREGVLWLPELEFAYRTEAGERRCVKANAVPVHAKVGAQIEVAEMIEDTSAPAPTLLKEPGVTLDGDASFAWRKACAKPTVEAFAAFDFPAAKLNEATCAIAAGDWSMALSIYRRLEWRIGQTPEIERGIRAALALRFENPNVDLPFWRVFLRPLLRFDWKGRVGLVLGGFAALVLLFWLLGRGIRALACLALALLLPVAAVAQDPFAQIEKMHRQMQQQMNQMMSQPFGGGFSMSFGGEEQEQVTVKASLVASKPAPQVGEEFEFILSLEAPKTSSIGQISIIPSNNFGLTVRGRVQNLPDGTSRNPTNFVKRLSIPVRYDVPYRGTIAFSVEGMVSGRQSRNGGRFSFTFSNSFRAETNPLAIEIKPLPSANQPADFSGIVSEGLTLLELPDLLKVETNDVITLTYRLKPKGYVPADYLLKDAAFEWTRQTDRENRPNVIEYRRFLVADGTSQTPEVSVSYYDPRTKTYRRAACGHTPITYVPSLRNISPDRLKIMV